MITCTSFPNFVRHTARTTPEITVHYDVIHALINVLVLMTDRKFYLCSTPTVPLVSLCVGSGTRK